MKGLVAIWVALFFIALSLPNAIAQTEKNVCTVYFTYVGCPHCAITDPVVLVELTEKYPNLAVIEYEFVLEPDNSYVLYAYNGEYNCGVGVPLVIFGEEKNVVGDTPILQNVENMIEKGPNSCPLLGGSVSFEDLDLDGLPRKPKVWTKDRILIKSGESGDNTDNKLLKGLLTSENLSALLEGASFEIIKPAPVLLSGIRFPQLDVLRSVEFEHAIKINDWVFQWNGEAISSVMPHGNTSGTESDDNTTGNFAQIRIYWDRMIISLISVVIIIAVISLTYRRIKSGKLL